VKLVERGEISLEDAVVRYIPEYPFAHVTLLHLMTHTTGYWDTPSTSSRMPPRSTQTGAITAEF